MISQEDIVSKVRSIMNEIGEDANTSLLEEDTIKIDEYIKSCIPEAVALVIQNSPNRCVNPKSSSSPSVTNNNDGTGSIVLPDDFISLIAFKMNGWKRIVSKAFDMDSEVYKAQGNPATRAGKFKPVCILAYNDSGKRTLEYYSIGSGETPRVEMFVYEAKYKEGDNLNMDEGNPLFGAVCYMCASLVYSIFENPNTAKEMQTTAINLIDNGVSHQ